MRLFIAINLPPAQRTAIHNATAPLRSASSNVTWVAADCLHLTMKFLGEQPEDSVATLSAALAAVAARFQPMRLDLGGIGAFPHFRSPRIFWLGIAPEPKLELLHHDLEVALERLGHEVDARPFRPHLTLGRVRRDVPAAESIALRDCARQVRYHAIVDVRSIDLMHSELGASGPRYTLVSAAPLRGA
jgi:2'-5' RNA ligase